MDYEQKYKNAFERAKIELNADTTQGTKNVLMTVFPELKESEDERIRKAILELVRQSSEILDEQNQNNMIAWLEKQKAMDKEIVFRPLAGTDIIVAAKQALEKIEIEKEIILAFNGAYIPVNGKTVAEICNEYFAWTEKQNKNNSENYCEDCINRKGCINCENGNLKETKHKVEPKFSEGDWITCKELNTAKIIKVNDDRYEVEFIDGSKGFPHIDYIDRNFHLWTIDDAKDGDVLYSLDSNRPFIYKERNGYEQATAYCGLNIYGKFFVWNTKDCIITTDKYIPATKEQRDTLLKAMADAGYTFDFEKKELKLLISNGGDFESDDSEQKPINDTVETIVEAVSNTSILDMIEDKDAFTNPGVFENSLGYLLKLFEKLPKQDLLDGLKFYANVVEHDGEYVKPATWSEDDERITTALMEGFRYHQLFNPKFGEVPNAEIISWIKSLKERLS